MSSAWWRTALFDVEGRPSTGGRANTRSFADPKAGGVGGSYFTRILRLSFLAPAIVKAILHDRHPIELTAKRLANQLRFPITWDEQRALLGTG